MDTPKPKIPKSKSSNSANTIWSDSRSNKKSRSAEFQPKILNRRGVYVEKKAAKLDLNAQTAQQHQKKMTPQPRPRPGKKRFLTSVFTILSKSIASTQFPEIDDGNIEKEKKNKHKRRLENNVEQTEDKKKYKYRSRVLNDNRNDTKKVLVLKPKREIVQTPSGSCNDQESTRWLNLPRLVEPESEMDTMTEIKSKYEGHVDAGTNVTDGRKNKEKRVVIVDDPKTLVSEETKEKGMYNFFVDLLESTLSVYNIKPDYDIPSSNVSVSKIDFVMDEKVAKKLNVTNENKEKIPELIDDVTQKPVKQQYFIRNETSWQDEQITDIKTEPLFPKLGLLKSTANSRRLKSKSFPGNGNPLSLPRATIKNKKKDILNILKDELRMDYADFEEPQNIFQALQVIAKNKRKCRKSIRFDTSALKTDNDSGDPECIFKRRNLMSLTRKSTKKNRDLLKSTPSISQYYSVMNKSNLRKKYTVSENTDLDESQHTLEVYGFEFDYPYARQTNDPKEVVLPYRSSSSISEINYNSNAFILNFSASNTSFNFPAL